MGACRGGTATGQRQALTSTDTASCNSDIHRVAVCDADGYHVATNADINTNTNCYRNTNGNAIAHADLDSVPNDYADADRYAHTDA